MAISPEVLVHDLVTALQGKLEQGKLDAAVQQILRGTATAYPAHGSVICAVFYMRFTVDCDACQNKQFVGNAGGIGTIGGGALIGDIYTDDLNRLLSSTSAFQFVTTPVYSSLTFFDGSSNFLGTFQAGGVSICTGTGGGTGSWS
jgi:hypothetical protein